jgi:uncharacterized protein (TIGR00251 family)
MKYTITVKTQAKKNAVEQAADGSLRVLVKAPPHEGRANEAVIETLAAHFKVPKSSVVIVGGFKSKTKIIQIG